MKNDHRSPQTGPSRVYQRGKDWLVIAGLFIDGVFLLILQTCGLSVSIREWAGQLYSSRIMVHAAYFSVFFLGLSAIHFPLRIISGYVWEHRFGLSTQSLSGWLGDHVKKTGLSFIFALIFIELLYIFIAAFPHQWWIGAGACWLTLSVMLAGILPQVIIPMFYQYIQIEDEFLKRRLSALFQNCQVTVKDVTAINFSSKSKKANAFVCGLGNKRRVVLTDTLLSHFSPAQIESVVAHELGHYKNRDILKILLTHSAVIFLSFYFADIFLNILLDRYLGLERGDIAAFPALAGVIMLLGWVSTPFLNAFSRFLEVRADRFSLRLTQNTDAFVSMMKKLGEINMSETHPSWIKEFLFFDHPSISRRIRLAEQYRTLLEKG